MHRAIRAIRLLHGDRKVSHVIISSRTSTRFLVVLIAAFMMIVAATVTAGEASAETSPARCGVSAHNPHFTYYKGQEVIKGVGEATCNYSVPKLYVKAQLWRTRWWGWEKVGYSPPASTTWKSKYKSTAYWNRSNCSGTHNWRTTAYGYSLENGKKYESSRTGYSLRLSC